VTLLPRKWLEETRAIPHFSNVIKNVGEQEGVEITMNCNHRAFTWVVDLIKIETDYRDECCPAENVYHLLTAKEKRAKVEEKLAAITNENCLNKLVTSHFLKVSWLYERIWSEFFEANFTEIINACQISLTNLSPSILADIAHRVKDQQLEGIAERRDKFISNVYRARIEATLMTSASGNQAN